MKIINAKAILLDMDGTLVQSTSEVEIVWAKWCEMNNIPIQSVLDICHGVRSRDVILEVAPFLDIEEQVELLNNLEIEYSKAGKAVAGAGHFLNALAPYSWAVVTSASQRVAYLRMEACGLKLPKLVIGSDDVVNGKPHPEPYLLAAERLGIATKDCLVFEDAPAGIQSALASGCRVVQVGGIDKLFDEVEVVIQNWEQVKVSGVDADIVKISFTELN
ncbi:HAD-IA family hydrolase [Photorhabdus stackebrandtii]|uniref:Haloacid dehalogenase n=1 Tax=Photorhabdus stackebrandtii TaxID=1123042 RepID=A0A7X5QN60_9GAMM|nr:HAD-IA family hydrolase [Photorhabdus stackebrandtii]NHB97362.1 haloacid dehalogenase [Photorhabdus stackebrandtii]